MQNRRRPCACRLAWRECRARGHSASGPGSPVFAMHTGYAKKGVGHEERHAGKTVGHAVQTTHSPREKVFLDGGGFAPAQPAGHTAALGDCATQTGLTHGLLRARRQQGRKQLLPALLQPCWPPSGEPRWPRGHVVCWLFSLDNMDFLRSLYGEMRPIRSLKNAEWGAPDHPDREADGHAHNHERTKTLATGDGNTHYRGTHSRPLWHANLCHAVRQTSPLGHPS